MAYREKLLGVDTETAAYVAAICRRDRNSMNQQILKLYALWQEYGTQRFSQAIGFCLQERRSALRRPLGPFYIRGIVIVIGSASPAAARRSLKGEGGS